MNIIEKKIDFSLCDNPIDFYYEEVPELKKADYDERINKLWNLSQAQKYDIFVIYGDREHFSNIYYFTGYDPRWEESILIMSKGKKPVLLVGNEGMGYAQNLKSDVETVMFQSFSLMGQPNDDRSRLLKDIFVSSGVKVNSRIGLIGWKAYQNDLFPQVKLLTDIPYYIVGVLSQIVPIEQIENAVELLSNCEYGLKHNIEAKEVVQFEILGTQISRGIYRFLKNLKPGMTETEAAKLLEFDGQPLNMHPNINFGETHVKPGLNSPFYSSNLRYGDLISVGYGMRGCLVHRCGMYIRDKKDLKQSDTNYIEDFLKPYFMCVAKWYEMLRIGTSFGEIYEMVDEVLGLQKFGIGLNPGHLTHTDEWTDTPFYRNSKVTVRSGMALQCDFTVSFENPYMSAHLEDGLIIADKELKEQIGKVSHHSLERMMARQKFIREQLNIDLPEEVLPMSDLGCVCFPYMADTSYMLVFDK